MNGHHLQWSAHCDQVDLHQLQALLAGTANSETGERRIEELGRALANSSPVISVWDGEKMIGLARATSDGIYRAVLWDVVIHPDYQVGELERQLVEAILSHPRMNRVERVYFMNSHQQRFYETLGFQSNPSTTMVLDLHPLSRSWQPLTGEKRW